MLGKCHFVFDRRLFLLIPTEIPDMLDPPWEMFSHLA